MRLFRIRTLASVLFTALLPFTATAASAPAVGHAITAQAPQDAATPSRFPFTLTLPTSAPGAGQAGATPATTSADAAALLGAALALPGPGDAPSPLVVAVGRGQTTLLIAHVPKAGLPRALRITHDAPDHWGLTVQDDLTGLLIATLRVPEQAGAADYLCLDLGDGTPVCTFVSPFKSPDPVMISLKR